MEIKGIPDSRKFPCSCGRSPTGRCIGWHSLTEEQYLKKLKGYKAYKHKIKKR
jgi:hypothetical protein